MKRRLLALSVFAAFCLPLNAALAQETNTFKTKYSVIHYDGAKDLSDFFWRLGGTRIDFSADNALASSRVDRIVERVETILDMRPKDLVIRIFLKRGRLAENQSGFYQNKTGDVYFCVDNVNDGIAAHEIAHAIIHKYFGPAVPSKTQEILSQYVDKYLWSDYS